MRTLFIAAALILGACSSTSEQPEASRPIQPTAESPTPTKPARSSPTKPKPANAPTAGERECLPVVAPNCGCVYSCGIGTRQPDGSYSVQHSFWKNTRLRARIADWCVNGACTPAFHAEIVCSGICPRRPADETCRFEADTCVGKSTKTP